MKPIYISMFIEKRYGDEWRRVFPKKRVQIEYLGETSIYWRGLGGGFALRMVQMTGEWVLFRRSHPTTFNDPSIRIARTDWDRLVVKVLARRGYL